VEGSKTKKTREREKKRPERGGQNNSKKCSFRPSTSGRGSFIGGKIEVKNTARRSEKKRGTREAVNAKTIRVASCKEIKS